MASDQAFPPGPPARRPQKSYPGLNQATTVLMADKTRVASVATPSREPSTRVHARSVSAPQAPLSFLPAIPDDLPQSYPQADGEAEGLALPCAYFSTEAGRYPPRRLPKVGRPPVVMRSDPQKDAKNMIAELRARYPQVCYSIFPESSNGHSKWDITWFFDEWDFYVQGSEFTYNVVLDIQNENEDLVWKTVQDWSEGNKIHYPWFPNQNFGIEEMFADSDRLHFGDEFCTMCLKAIRIAFDKARTHCQAARHASESSEISQIPPNQPPKLAQISEEPQSVLGAGQMTPSGSFVPPNLDKMSELSLTKGPMPNNRLAYHHNPHVAFHPEAMPEFVKGQDVYHKGAPYPQNAMARMAHCSNQTTTNLYQGPPYPNNVFPHLALPGVPPNAFVSFHYHVMPGMAQKHAGPVVMASEQYPNVHLAAARPSNAGSAAAPGYQDPLLPRPNGSHNWEISQNADSQASQSMHQEQQLPKRGGRKFRGAGSRFGAPSRIPRRSSLSQSINSSDEHTPVPCNPPVQAWKEPPASSTKNRRAFGRFSGSSESNNSYDAPPPSYEESLTPGKHDGHGRFGTDKPKAPPSTKKTRQNPNLSRRLTENRQSFDETTQARPKTPPKAQLPIGRRSPDEVYANVSAEVKKHMIRRHFIGEDIEYLRQLAIGGVQPNMSEREICDAIGEFAAVSRIEFTPDRKGAYVHFHSTADTRKVLAQFEISCKGRPLFLEVPRRFLRTGSETSDYEPPSSSPEPRQDTKPRTTGFAPHHANISPTSRPSSNTRNLPNVQSRQRRKSGSGSSDSAVPLPAVQSKPIKYTPQDARSSLGTTFTATATPTPKAVGKPVNTWATVVAAKPTETKVQCISSLSQPRFTFPAIIEEDENSKVDEKPHDTNETNDPKIDETRKIGNENDAEIDEKAKLSNETSDAKIDNVTNIGNETDEKKETHLDQKVEMVEKTIQFDEVKELNETKIDQEPKSLDETNDTEIEKATQIAADTSMTNESETEKKAEIDNTIQIDNSIQIEDTSQIDSTIQIDNTTQIDNTNQIDNTIQIDTPALIDEPREEQQSSEPSDKTLANEEALSKCNENTQDPTPTNPPREPSKKNKVKPSLPKINTSRSRSSTGSSSTELGSATKLSTSANRKLAGEIYRLRQEEQRSLAEQGSKKKHDKVARRTSPPATSKPSSSPSPAGDSKKGSPSGSAHHSPSASRDQTNKPSPGQPCDLGRWQSEYEKALGTNAKVSDDIHKATWSRELATLKTELDSLEERYAQNYEKYLNGTKSGKKSAKKALPQLARGHKDKIEELAMLHGRIAREVDSHAMGSTTKPKSQSYPAFHQPSAQETLASAPTNTKSIPSRTSSLSTLEQRESVMTPQSGASNQMRSIDSVVWDNDTEIVRALKLSTMPVIIACPKDNDKTACPTEASSTVVGDDADQHEPQQPAAAKPQPKSYASVVASGASAPQPTIKTSSMTKAGNTSPKPALGLGITKSLASKIEKRPAELGEWDSPEGPWGQAGLSSKPTSGGL